ncbi:hypothetical protein ACRRTK_024315 [Alexandromys fortis]
MHLYTFPGVWKLMHTHSSGSHLFRLHHSASDTSDKNRVKSRLKKFISRRPSLKTLQEKGLIKDQTFGSHLHTVCEREHSTVPWFVKQCIEAVEKRAALRARREDNFQQSKQEMACKSRKEKPEKTTRKKSEMARWRVGGGKPLKEAFVILEINIAKLGAFYLTPKIMIVHAELGFPSLDVDGIYRVSGNLATIQKLKFIVNQEKRNRQKSHPLMAPLPENRRTPNMFHCRKIKNNTETPNICYAELTPCGSKDPSLLLSQESTRTRQETVRGRQQTRGVLEESEECLRDFFLHAEQSHFEFNIGCDIRHARLFHYKTLHFKSPYLVSLHSTDGVLQDNGQTKWKISIFNGFYYLGVTRPHTVFLRQVELSLGIPGSSEPVGTQTLNCMDFMVDSLHITSVRSVCKTAKNRGQCKTIMTVGALLLS